MYVCLFYNHLTILEIYKPCHTEPNLSYLGICTQAPPNCYILYNLWCWHSWKFLIYKIYIKDRESKDVCYPFQSTFEYYYGLYELVHVIPLVHFPYLISFNYSLINNNLVQFANKSIPVYYNKANSSSFLQEAERILKKASLTHKEKVEEFNRHLDSLTEHFDIPKVSWTKWSGKNYFFFLHLYYRFFSFPVHYGNKVFVFFPYGSSNIGKENCGNHWVND